jgi:uncharacterized membrane protein
MVIADVIQEQPTVHAASAHVTGAPALIIILVILVLIVVGLVTVVRAVARKAKD